MTVYLTADVKVTDQAWLPAYAEQVHEIVHKHGGRYLARSGNVTPLEGEAPEVSLVVLIAFPSAAAAKAFVADPHYAPFASSRRSGSTGHLRLVDDTDIAGTIAYLPRG